MQAPEQLFSAVNKLHWAKLLASNLEQMYNEYFRSRPYRLEYHPHPEEGFGAFSVNEIQPFSTQLVMLAGDVFHNARASLDHLAYELARLHSPAATENELYGVTFPVEQDAKQWTKRKGRMKLLSPEVQQRIEELQPFNAARAGDSLTTLVTQRMLGRLAELDRTDKHRMLNLVLVGSGRMGEPRFPEPFSATSYSVNAGPLPGTGIEFAQMSFDGAVPESLPPTVDPYELIPLALCFPDHMIGEPGNFTIMVYDLMNTVFGCLDAAERVLTAFFPCFSGEAPHPLT